MDASKNNLALGFPFHSWPNGGVPERIQDLLDLVQLVEKLEMDFKKDLVTAKTMLHCSGGRLEIDFKKDLVTAKTMLHSLTYCKI